MPMLPDVLPEIESLSGGGPHRVCIGVGGISLGLESQSSDGIFLGGKLEAFRVSRVPDIQVNVAWSESLRSSTSLPEFNSGSLWSLYHDKEELVFEFISPMLAVGPYKRLRVDRSFRRADLTLSRSALERHNPIFPLEYPADELLVTNYLASEGLGVEVHGCGLIDSDTGGHLFIGHSGAGKSTTTQLWQSLRNAEILSDDRIILRIHDGELWMYGTPWHGDAEFASPACARLSRIFVLQHGERNRMAPLTRSLAVGELFARSFPPFHSAQGLDQTVEFLEKIVDCVPCYEFQFVPDRSAIEEVLTFNG